MSSNFYTSTHNAYWLLTRSALETARATDLKYASERQLYCLNIYFAMLIQKVGRRLALRQIVIATATVFFRRFYTKNSICETNPYLVLAACLFVAAKVEETPVHIKSVVSEAKLIFGEHNIKMFPAEPDKLGEMEFYLLEDLDFHLVVFHAYRALVNITGREPVDGGRFDKSRVEEDAEVQKKLGEARKKRDDEVKKGAKLDEVEGEGEGARIRRLMGRGSGEGLMEIDEGTLQIAWFTITDTYRTDIPLLYPPYVIALAALYIAFMMSNMTATTTSARTRSSSQVTSLATSIDTNAALGLDPPPASPAEFLASFEVHLPTLFACVQDVLSLYPVWESFEPSQVRGGGAAAAAAAVAAAAGANAVGGEKFGAEEAEVLVRRMIEQRMVDIGHPEDAGKKRTR